MKGGKRTSKKFSSHMDVRSSNSYHANPKPDFPAEMIRHV